VRGIMKVVIGGLIVLAIIVVAASVLSLVLSHRGSQRPSTLSGSKTAPSPSTPASPSAQPRILTGSWVPSEGSVVWTDRPGNVGYDFGQTAPHPGGLLISKQGGAYKITLVSSTGARYPATTHAAGKLLGVLVSRDPLFYLKQTAPDTLSMYDYEGQFQLAMDFKRGSPSPPGP